MAGRLADRVAIVTGAASGQGAATARLFAAEGARVILTDINKAAGERVAAEIGGAAVFHTLDVADEAQWAAMVQAGLAKWGRIDALVNNAGMVIAKSIFDHTPDDFRRMMEVNLLGCWLGMRAVTPAMIAQGKGAIVNTSSTVAFIAHNGVAAYGASKWALRGLSRIAAMELGPKKVRVNMTFPGGINTPMVNVNDTPTEAFDESFRYQPIQRIGEPDEVAQVNLFLVSDESSYLCGAELAVDGGQTMGRYVEQLPGMP